MRRRLLITYTLMPIMVAVIAVVVFLYAMGWRYSQNEHDLERGGLLQLDSRPRGAIVTVDGKRLSGKTKTRLDTSAGQKTVSMKLAGYTPWQKTITVPEGGILWLDYVRMVPEEIASEQLASFADSTKGLTSRSGKSIAVIESPSQPVIQSIKISGDSWEKSPVELPSAVITTGTSHQYSLEAWDASGRSLLVKHVVDGTTEWLAVDVAAPEDAVNISQIVPQAMTGAPRFDTRDRSVLYVLASGELRKVDLDGKTVSAPLLTRVVSYAQSASGILSYTSRVKSTDDKRVAGYISRGATEAKQVRSVLGGGKSDFAMQIAEYSDRTYMIVRSGASLEINRVSLRPSDSNSEVSMTHVATLALPKTVTSIDLSPSQRFVVVRTASGLMTYDLELETLSTVSLKKSTLTDELMWIDNFHLAAENDDGELEMIEFDGSNPRAIGIRQAGAPLLLSDNDKWLYTFTTTGGKVNLVRYTMTAQ